MKKNYEVIHAHAKMVFSSYERAIEFAKEMTTPIYNEDSDAWDLETCKYDKALIITTEMKEVHGINLEIIHVQLLEFMYDGTWSISDMKI